MKESNDMVEKFYKVFNQHVNMTKDVDLASLDKRGLALTKRRIKALKKEVLNLIEVLERE